MAEGGGSRVRRRKKQHTGSGERCSTPDRISQFLDRARSLKLRVPFSPRQLRKVQTDIRDAKPIAVPRPSLQRPSRVTEQLVLEIMHNLYTLDNQQLNTDLIVSNLALCDPNDDLLLVEDSDHYNLLHKAIIFGELQLLELLLDHGVDPNGLKSEEICGNGRKCCSHEHLGALHLACFLGHKALVCCLLDHGASTSLQMKVYTSAVVHDQLGLQPAMFSSGLQNKTVDMLSKCGCRHPIFYATLNNQLETLITLLQAQSRSSETQTFDNRYLCHLACRVRAYECFEYLLKEYPRAINTKDTDGLPLLLMALNNNMKFVKLLLDQECDIHVLDNFWEPGTNILHLLFHGVITQSANALHGLKDVTVECLKRGADVNAQRIPSKATPLHDLLRSLNSPMNSPYQISPGELGLDTLEQMDNELIGCMSVLLSAGADIHLKDCDNKTPLQILLSNSLHVLRYNASRDERLSSNEKRLFAGRSFGMDNTVECVQKLIALGALQQDGKKHPIMENFVELVQTISLGTSYSSMDFNHSFQVLQVDAIFEKYVQLMKILLAAGADPNLASQSQLSPLLSLLLHLDESPQGDINDVDTAERLITLISIMIENGAHTEVEIDMHGTGRRVIGCFDMLTSLLEKMQTHHRPVKDLEVFHTLVLALIQHGASTNVYQKLLYFIDSVSLGRRGSRGTSMPKHTFLCQYILFGMHNLHYASDGNWYMRIFNVLYCQIEHYMLNDVLAMTQANSSDMHSDVDCDCKKCNFKFLLDSVRGKPRSLKILCRLAVYNSVKGRLVFTVPHLPLPPVLKTYLMSFQP